MTSAPVAVLPNHHKLGGFKLHKFITVVEVRGAKIRKPAGCAPGGSGGEEALPAALAPSSSSKPAVFQSLCLSVHRHVSSLIFLVWFCF